MARSLLKGKTVTVDFRLFNYLNATTQAPILQFLELLGRNDVHTKVSDNVALDGQRTSCRCMKILCRAVPVIQFECTQ